MSVITGTLEKFVSKASDSPLKLALIAAGVILASVGVYSISQGGESGLLPALTEQEAQEIMQKILEKLKLESQRMVRAAEQIKQQITAQGQEIDNATLMKTFILPHFETRFRELEMQIYDERDVEEFEVEEAVNYYINNGNNGLREICEHIKLLYKEFGGEVEEDRDESKNEQLSIEDGSEAMDIPQILRLLQALAETVNERTDDYVSEFIHENGTPTPSNGLFEDFQQGMMVLSEQAEKEVLEKVGITQLQFQQAIMRHQESPAIQQAVMMMQMQNHEILQKRGIGVGMF